MRCDPTLDEKACGLFANGALSAAGGSLFILLVSVRDEYYDEKSSPGNCQRSFGID